MDATYVFAGLLVSDRDQAAAWYERLLGRPPTFLPNDAEAVWQLAATASVYLLADPPRAGGGIMSVVVEDLNETLSELEGRGIVPDRIDVMEAGRKAVIEDPDGNVVSIIEIGEHT
jgi:hypothetical protein